MFRINIAGASLNQIPRDWEGNTERILEAITEAQKLGVSALCLPELAITGYSLEDEFFCPDVAIRAAKQLKQIAAATVTKDANRRGMIAAVGLPVQYGNALFNAVAVLIEGELVALVCKQHLAGDGIHYEQRQFKPWPPGVLQAIKLPGWNKEVPIGDAIIQAGGVRCAFEVCEDAWVSTRPGAKLAQRGVDIIFNPSASHFAFGKLPVRKRFVVEGSRAFGTVYVYANLNGLEAGRAIFDGGVLIASTGTLLAQGPRLSFKDVNVTAVTVDIENNRMQQVRTASFQPDIANENTNVIDWPFFYPPVASPMVSCTVSSDMPLSPDGVQVLAWEVSPNLKFEEFLRAEGLALMDYTRKSHTKGYVVSLSGGADSAVCTLLAAYGVYLGVTELGMDAFVKEHCPHITKLDGVQSLLNQLLTTAYQPSAQSGQETKDAAATIAARFSTKHSIFDVEPAIQSYIAGAEKALGHKLDWNNPTESMSLENVQARARSPYVWMLANLEEKILITTSNRSEAAVGYATMDGDTSGCLAPIAGVDKPSIINFLEFMETTGISANIIAHGRGPQSCLSVITKQKPKAELKPVSFAQTDEGDLMPYPVLNYIENLMIQDRRGPLDIYELLLEARSSGHRSVHISPQTTDEQMEAWVRKFFTLFARNQWKRERYAPSSHLDSRNLDPRTWCRTPILNAGYREELAEITEARKFDSVAAYRATQQLRSTK